MIRWNILDPRDPSAKARLLIEGPTTFKERKAFEVAMRRASAKFHRLAGE